METEYTDKEQAGAALIEALNAQLETAKGELGKPFPRETELNTKVAWLAQLNILLSIDGKEELAADKKTADKLPTSIREKIQYFKAVSEKKRAAEIRN